MLTNLNGLNILIIDDIPEHGIILERSISTWNHKVKCFSEFNEAIKMIENWDNIYNPVDVAIIDYYMPGLNGIEVGKILKELDPLIAIVIITADASPETAKEILSSGLELKGFITKDEGMDVLFTVLEYIKAEKEERLKSLSSYIKERAAPYRARKKNNILEC